MASPPLICVFCGSSNTVPASDVAVAAEFARACVVRGWGIIYGAGRTGLMGDVADAALAVGGTVVGVIPEFLETKELCHPGLTELHVVQSMHERKALMAARAAAFVTLPGGLGTLDELCEILTWSQLDLHAKPVGLLNPRNYFAGLLTMLDQAVTDGYLRQEHRARLMVETDGTRLLDRLEVTRDSTETTTPDPDRV